jgi:hypothetical protein
MVLVYKSNWAEALLVSLKALRFRDGEVTDHFHRVKWIVINVRVSVAEEPVRIQRDLDASDGYGDVVSGCGEMVNRWTTAISSSAITTQRPISRRPRLHLLNKNYLEELRAFAFRGVFGGFDARP